MRQSLVITLLVTLFIGVSTSFATTKEGSEKNNIARLFEQFEKEKSDLFKSDLTKANIKSKFEATSKNLEKFLDEVKAIEAKSDSDLLTNEGNEMAYDIEVLEPLKTLAAGLLTKEECVKAKFEHELNFPVIEDEQAASIQNLINTICTN